MLYMIGDKIVEITKTDSSYGWNNVVPPNIEEREVIDLFIPRIDCVGMKSSYDIEVCINAVNTDHYYVMSQTELTEFAYRISTWTMGEVFNGMSSFVGMFN